MTVEVNRSVLVWLIGGVIVVIGALGSGYFAVRANFKSREMPEFRASVQASRGGVAVGGSVSGSQIRTGGK